jgi:hypothetical protein
MSLDDDEIIPYSETLVDRPAWTDADHLCVVGEKQLDLEENQILQKSIEELYEGEADINPGIYYYVIKKDDSERVNLFHKDNDRTETDKNNKKNKTGHSSLITYEEYTEDLTTSENLDRGQNKDPSCIVLYAGELIYRKKQKDDSEFDESGVLKWSNASGHFRPREEQAEKVGFPMIRFIEQMTPFNDNDAKDAYTGGKRKKTKKSNKTKKTRKHQGIVQTGGNAGRLRKGYRYSGKKLKSGLPQIIKCKSKKC